MLSDRSFFLINYVDHISLKEIDLILVLLVNKLNQYFTTGFTNRLPRCSAELRWWYLTPYFNPFRAFHSRAYFPLPVCDAINWNGQPGTQPPSSQVQRRPASKKTEAERGRRRNREEGWCQINSFIDWLMSVGLMAAFSNPSNVRVILLI